MQPSPDKYPRSQAIKAELLKAGRDSNKVQLGKLANLLAETAPDEAGSGAPFVGECLALSARVFEEIGALERAAELFEDAARAYRSAEIVSGEAHALWSALRVYEDQKNTQAFQQTARRLASAVLDDTNLDPNLIMKYVPDLGYLLLEFSGDLASILGRAQRRLAARLDNLLTMLLYEFHFLHVLTSCDRNIEDLWKRVWPVAEALAVEGERPNWMEWRAVAQIARRCGQSELAERIEQERLPGSLRGGSFTDPREQMAKLLKHAEAVAKTGGDAGAAYEEAVAFATNVFGPSEEEIVAQWNYGHWLREKGRFAAAAKMLQAAFQNMAGERDLDSRLRSGMIAREVARVRDLQGEYYLAAEWYQIAHSYFSSVEGPSGENAAQQAYNVGECARMSLDFERAERWFLAAIEGEMLARGDRTLTGAYARNNLGDLYLSMDRPDLARPLVEFALTVRRELLPAGAPQIRRSEHSLKDIEETEAAIAEGLWDEVYGGFKLRRKRSPSSRSVAPHDHYAQNLYELDLAIEAARNGRFADAIAIHEEVAAKPRETQADLELSIRNRLLHALCLWSLGQSAEGRAKIFELFEDERALLTKLLPAASRRHSHDLLRRSRDYLSLLYTNILEGGENADDLNRANSILASRRALETRLIRSQKLGMRARAQDRAPLRAARQQLAKAQTDMETSASTLRWHLDEVEHHERRLANIAGWTVVVDQLAGGFRTPNVPEGALILEYLLRPASFQFGLSLRDNDGDYLCIARFGTESRVFQVDAARNVDLLVTVLRTAITDSPFGSDGWLRKGKPLYNKLLRPVESWLNEAEAVYVVPDGMLGLLPFDVLPLPDGRIAAERWRLSYLESGSELGEMFLVHEMADTGPPLVIAAPDFGDPEVSTVEGRLAFTPLTHAMEEGKSIADLIEARCLVGQDASWENLATAPSPEILHLSTHGYFVDRGGHFIDPLQNCGVALAGANLSNPEFNGIALGSDIAELSLQGTDLVVIASCETAVGPSRRGDGIHSLRRAFRAAGAKSVVSALWAAPDPTTRQLMSHFYEELMAGTGRSEALRRAKLHVRATDSDPVHWAAFVLEGRSRPLLRTEGWFPTVEYFDLPGLRGFGLRFPDPPGHPETPP